MTAVTESFSYTLTDRDPETRATVEAYRERLNTHGADELLAVVVEFSFRDPREWSGAAHEFRVIALASSGSWVTRYSLYCSTGTGAEADAESVAVLGAALWAKANLIEGYIDPDCDATL